MDQKEFREKEQNIRRYKSKRKLKYPLTVPVFMDPPDYWFLNTTQILAESFICKQVLRIL